MLLVIFCLICFFASIIGAICGIGGSVIIKPVLDAFGIMDVATISFLSRLHCSFYDYIFCNQKQTKR